MDDQVAMGKREKWAMYKSGCDLGPSWMISDREL